MILMSPHSAGKKTVAWKFFPWNQFRVSMMCSVWFSGFFCDRNDFMKVLAKTVKESYSQCGNLRNFSPRLYAKIPSN